jgi:hypothetical protein
MATGDDDGGKQAGWRQRSQGRGEEAHTAENEAGGEAGLDEARQDHGRVHGGEEGREEIQRGSAREEKMSPPRRDWARLLASCLVQGID